MPGKRQKITHNTPQKVDERPEEPVFIVDCRPTPAKRKAGGKNQSDTDKFTDYESAYDPSLNLQYRVTCEGNEIQEDAWDKIRSYRAFQLDDTKQKIAVGSCVAVRGEEDPSKNTKERRKDSTEVAWQWWYAQVLECRAEDSAHVYLRIAWLYKPEDLVGGRQPYHGSNEVIPSNDMQIISAIAVHELMQLQQWAPEKDPRLWDAPDCLVWRQTINIHNPKTLANKPTLHGPTMSGLEVYCTCKQPANPDQAMVHCKECDKWMHEDCIVEAAKRIVVEQEVQEPNASLTPSGKDVKSSSFSTKILNSLKASFSGLSRESTPTPTRSRTHRQTKSAGKADPAIEAVPKDKEQRSNEDGTLASIPGAEISRPSPQKSIAPQKRKHEATTLEMPIEATAKQRSGAKRSTVNATTISKLTYMVKGLFDGSKKVVVVTKGPIDESLNVIGEMPIHCLFEDCGKLVP